MSEAWWGCKECDVSFPCHNGEKRCIRLPGVSEETDKLVSALEHCLRFARIPGQQREYFNQLIAKHRSPK